MYLQFQVVLRPPRHHHAEAASKRKRFRIVHVVFDALSGEESSRVGGIRDALIYLLNLEHPGPVDRPRS